MDQKQQSRRQPTRMRVLWAGGIVVALTVSILIGIAFLGWIGVAIVPVVIAAGVLSFFISSRNSTPSLTATSGGGGSRSVLETLGGLAAIGSGILALLAILALLLQAVLQPEAQLPLRVLFFFLFGLSTLLLAIALPGLQARQAGRARRLGWVGFTLAMIGVVLFSAFLFLQGVWVALPGTAFSVWWSSWDLALGPGLFLLGGGTAVVGIAVFGIATARASVLPSWAAVMFALAWPIGIAIGWLYAVFLPGAIEDDPGNLVFRVVQSTGLAISALGLIRLGYALFAHVRLKKKLSERLPELSRPHLPRSWLPRTGFGNKTVWDWLQLLIVPIVLAVASFWFTLQQDTRQQATEDQRAQDAALQAYLDKIGEFMLKENGRLRESEGGDEVNTLARARTLTVLSRLDGDRKARVVQFLYESRLIAKERPVLDFRGADLNDVSLNNVDLSGANLYGAQGVIEGTEYVRSLEGATMPDGSKHR